MRGYNNGPVYVCFNDPFTVFFGIPYFNIPTMPLNESSRQSKRAYYNPYELPDFIYVASGKYVSTLTTPSGSPQYILLSSDASSTDHTIVRDKTVCVKDKIVYCSRLHELIRFYRKSR